MEKNRKEINHEITSIYINQLIGRIYKILPMFEEENKTLDLYVESLIREMIGNASLIDLYREDILEAVGTLKGIEFDNHKKVKSDVLKACNIFTRARKKAD